MMAKMRQCFPIIGIFNMVISCMLSCVVCLNNIEQQVSEANNLNIINNNAEFYRRNSHRNDTKSLAARWKDVCKRDQTGSDSPKSNNHRSKIKALSWANANHVRHRRWILAYNKDPNELISSKYHIDSSRKDNIAHQIDIFVTDLSHRDTKRTSFETKAKKMKIKLSEPEVNAINSNQIYSQQYAQKNTVWVGRPERIIDAQTRNIIQNITTNLKTTKYRIIWISQGMLHGMTELTIQAETLKQILRQLWLRITIPIKRISAIRSSKLGWPQSPSSTRTNLARIPTDFSEVLKHKTGSLYTYSTIIDRMSAHWMDISFNLRSLCNNANDPTCARLEDSLTSMKQTTLGLVCDCDQLMGEFIRLKQLKCELINRMELRMMDDVQKAIQLDYQAPLKPEVDYYTGPLAIEERIIRDTNMLIRLIEFIKELEMLIKSKLTQIN